MKATLYVLLLSFGVVYQVYSQKEASSQANELYACLPCGSDCDRMVVDKPGNCQHCGMPLVLKKSIVFTNVTPAELCNIVAARPDVVLLDVRTPDEFAGRAAEKFGHLKNAINIPIQQLRSRLAELDAYKNREIIVYCSHNHRSPQASQLLTDNGFKHIKNMTGGMSVWADSVGTNAIAKSLLVN